MTRCYLSIGSNIEREASIASGLKALEHHFGCLILSSIYESAPVGFQGDAFYNMVAGFDTDLEIKALAKTLRDIEIANGRPLDSKKFSSRKLDLDLILYGNAVINDDSLQIPRSDIERYAFVLEPLAEIAPTLIHPVLQLSIADLWQRMPKDGLQQQKIDAHETRKSLLA
ncbi:MAG: 2-amino-4-hydroxy-6-hydroxymethyldihydropteridine diphosphokinase [Methylococcaceae bacterium]|nr:2-amino-4-hydroxy-6-hydroxymethyldihydropteridine diphosphokinase [Methylococcaceae bacterium]